MRTPRYKAGQAEKAGQSTAESPKDQVAVALKKLTGTADSKAREASLTPAQRREIARRAARTR
jgi:hypothetical protein